MKTPFKLIVLLVLSSLALSGCSAVRAILSGGSEKEAAADQAAAADQPAVADEAVVASNLTFYDSWASW